MNISEYVQALSRKHVPYRPWRSVRFPWPNGAGKATTVRTLRTPTTPHRAPRPWQGSAAALPICISK